MCICPSVIGVVSMAGASPPTLGWHFLGHPRLSGGAFVAPTNHSHSQTAYVTLMELLCKVGTFRLKSGNELLL